MPKLALRQWLSIALPGVLILLLLGAAPAVADAASTAEFVRATCLGGVEDLAKVDSLATAKGWQAVTDTAGMNQGDLQLKSVYEATEAGDKFVVVTGFGKWQTGGQANLCMVMFPGQQVAQPDFFKAISAGLELKTIADMNFPQGRMEMYEIQSDRPQKVILQMMSMTGGNLIQVAMFAPQ
jgi:hypothetical protein